MNVEATEIRADWALPLINDEIVAEYVEMYGDPAEAGSGDTELFLPPRGRLYGVFVDAELAGVCGWTRVEFLGSSYADLPNLYRTVELKRMFIRKSHRKLGLTSVMDKLRLKAIFNEGYERAIGEAGPEQAASIAYHQRADYGYHPVDPFGPWKNNPGSVFFGVTRQSWERSL